MQCGRPACRRRSAFQSISSALKMQRSHDEAGPSRASTVVSQRSPASIPTHFSISCLLEFRNAQMEAAYQQYMYKMQQTADMCHMFVNLMAVAVACMKQFTMPLNSGPPGATLCLLSGSQSLLLLLMLLVFPAFYARHRGLVISCVRMYRLAIWLMYLHEPYPPRLITRNLSLRLFFLSPAGGNVWLALFYALPLSLHVLLLGFSSLVATWRSPALQERLLGLNVSPEQLTQAYQQINRFSRLFELPTGRLLQRWPVPAIESRDRLWCMYAFVTIVYGFMLPLLLLFVKEVHFRVRFLSCIRPALSEQQLMSIRSTIYSTTTAACFLIATMVPCSWTLVQLAARYLAAQQGQLQPTGVLALLTLLALEVFMRFWFLAVMQLVWHRGIRPGLMWLLFRLAGPQYTSTAFTSYGFEAGAVTGVQGRQ